MGMKALGWGGYLACVGCIICVYGRVKGKNISVYIRSRNTFIYCTFPLTAHSLAAFYSVFMFFSASIVDAIHWQLTALACKRDCSVDGALIFTSCVVIRNYIRMSVYIKGIHTHINIKMITASLFHLMQINKWSIPVFMIAVIFVKCIHYNYLCRVSFIRIHLFERRFIRIRKK